MKYMGLGLELGFGVSQYYETNAMRTFDHHPLGYFIVIVGVP